MNDQPRDELHVHLYGCLTPEDLWRLGKTRPRDEQRLQWYADEYEKAFGRRPDGHAYWINESGLDVLARDYLITKPVNFAQFQACINLPIALFPINPVDTTLLETVARRDANNGLRYVEYRVFLAPYLSAAQRKTFLDHHAAVCAKLEAESGGSFQPRLILSMAREACYYLPLYEELRAWLNTQIDLHRIVVGIDFCAAERGFPPLEKAAFMKKICTDNAEDRSRALAVVYHVGEQLNELPLGMALQWIHEASVVGMHRLGHACALGVDISHLGDRLGVMNPEQLESFYRWMSDDEGEVGELARAESIEHAAQPSAAFLIRVQNAVANSLVRQGAIIETCPSSNLYLSGITHVNAHPFRGLIKRQGLKLTIGSDDPGIFATTLLREYEMAATSLKVTAETLQNIKRENPNYRCEALTRL